MVFELIEQSFISFFMASNKSLDYKLELLLNWSRNKYKFNILSVN